jgi:hypothetical protein
VWAVLLKLQHEPVEPCCAQIGCAVSVHVSVQASIREYYEAQLCELMERLADVHEASSGDVGSTLAAQVGQHGDATITIAAAEAREAVGGAHASPAAVGVGGMGDNSPDSRPASAAARAAAAGRSPSPSTLLRRSRNAALLSSPAAAAAAAGGSVDEAVFLRRELLSAESLLQSSQEENRAAAKRIKVGQQRGCHWCMCGCRGGVSCLLLRACCKAHRRRTWQLRSGLLLGGKLVSSPPFRLAALRCAHPT